MNVLLVPAHPGFPGQIPQSRKTVVLCVCVVLQNSKQLYIVNTCSFNYICSMISIYTTIVLDMHLYIIDSKAIVCSIVISMFVCLSDCIYQ